MSERFLFVFLDGIGIGSANPDENPFFQVDNWFRPLSAAETVELPHGGKAKGLDASLGVPGIPQSATGQTSLFTGVNAQKAIGEHRSGGPTPALKEIIHRGNLLKWANERGLSGTFANAYLDDFFSPEYSRRDSVTTTMMRSSGYPFRRVGQIEDGQAVYHEFTHRFLQSLGYEIPLYTPEQSAQNLARLAHEHHVTVYEHFMSDFIGHSQDLEQAVEEVENVQRFVAALLEELRTDEVNVVISSDHGNLEHIRQKEHTLNPVPGMFWGPWADEAVEQVQAINQITPAILHRLNAAK